MTDSGDPVLTRLHNVAYIDHHKRKHRHGQCQGIKDALWPVSKTWHMLTNVPSQPAQRLQVVWFQYISAVALPMPKSFRNPGNQFFDEFQKDETLIFGNMHRLACCRALAHQRLYAWNFQCHGTLAHRLQADANTGHHLRPDMSYHGPSPFASSLELCRPWPAQLQQLAKTLLSQKSACIAVHVYEPVSFMQDLPFHVASCTS